MIINRILFILFVWVSVTKADAIDRNLLNGSWEFYWDKLYEPKDFRFDDVSPPQIVEVPNSWTLYQDETGENFPKYGVATYRKLVLFDSKQENVAIRIPKIWCASKVWINGKLVSEQGSVSKSSYYNLMLESYVRLGVTENTEIIIQVANYSLFVGGIVVPLEVGYHDNLYRETIFSRSLEILWIGAVLIMSLYHFILFFFRRRAPSALYFGIICLLIAVKQTVFGEHYLYEFLKVNHYLSFRWQSTLYYLSTYSLAWVGLLYIQSLYPKEVMKKAVITINYIFLAYVVFLLISPTSIYLPTIFPFQVLVFASGLYIVYVIVQAYRRRRNEANFQALGILVMIVAGISDALSTFGVDIFGNQELVPFAFGVLLLLQFVVLSRRFSTAFRELEDLSANLEQKVTYRTAEVNRQKEEIAEKNAHITSSINYAKRIQDAILPSNQDFKSLFPNSFILFKPKDVVSGDFYFAEGYEDDENQLKVVAAVDCTGHGVPGALMSMIGNSLLKSIIHDYKIFNPSMILTQLNESVRTQLQQDTTDNQDGMDIAVCVIDEKNGKLMFAGAKNPLVYIENEELKVLKGDRLTVGGYAGSENMHFHDHTMDVRPGTKVYLFSDGFQDQIGGAKGKKFMVRHFHQLLMDTKNDNLQKQGDILENRFNLWKNGYDQVDDVLVIGIELR